MLPGPAPADFNRALVAALASGQNAALLPLDAAARRGRSPLEAGGAEIGADGVSLADATDVATALHGVDFSGAPLRIETGAVAGPFAAVLAAAFPAPAGGLGTLKGAVTADPLAWFATEGLLGVSLATCLDDLAGWTALVAGAAPEVKTIGVDSAWVLEAGGNAVQELAAGLAMAVEYLRALEERRVPVAVSAPRCAFSFAIGPQFFLEIAKLRAFRLLWSRVLAAWGDPSLAAAAGLHARTARFDKTILDPHVNLLRTTTESLAAVLGGADSVQVGPFDEMARVPGELSQRIARNIALMLSAEFNFHEVTDAAGGSFFVEALTDELARKAWALFQEIEGKGGFVTTLTQGVLQTLIAATAAEKRRQLDTRRLAILGTNLFPNLREKPLPVSTFDAAAWRAARRAEIAARANPAAVNLPAAGNARWSARFEQAVAAAKSGATLAAISAAWLPAGETVATVQAARPWRAAEGFEALRATADRYAQTNGRRPQVFLAKMGPVKQHKPRADFSAGFFAVGGFEALGKDSFVDAAAAAEAAHASGAPIVVLCSTDETYPTLVPAFAAAAKAHQPALLVVLAGLPADAATVETYRQAGIDAFIHVRANVRVLLAQLLAKIGAK